MDAFLSLMPEFFLAITLAGLIASEIGFGGEKLRLMTVTAVLGLSTAFVQTLLNFPLIGQKFFGHAISVDSISYFFKLFFIFFALLVVVITYFARDVSENKRSEANSFIIAATLAQCILVQAGDLLLVYVSLQAIVVLSVFIVGLSNQNFRSLEAGSKLLIFGSVALGLFLFGAGLLFQATQSLNLFEIQSLLVNESLSRESSLFVFTLIFLSLAFFIGIFPMFFWAPDVLEGAPMPSSLFVGLGIPASGMALALRIFLEVFSVPSSQIGQWSVSWSFDWTVIVSFSGGATALIGALLAFRQKSFKRMISCLVLSQMGFLAVGLTVLDQAGIAALFYNLIVLLFSLVGIYAVISHFNNEQIGMKVDDLFGAIRKSKIETLFFIFFLSSLLGIPPAPGFISKFVLMNSIIEDQRFFLVFVLILTLVVWMASFGKLAYSLSQSNSSTKEGISAAPKLQQAFIICMAGPMVLLSIFADPVLLWVKSTLLGVFW